MTLQMFVQMCNEMSTEMSEILCTAQLQQHVEELLTDAAQEEPVVMRGHSPKRGLSLIWVQYCLEENKVKYNRVNNIFQGWTRKKAWTRKQEGDNPKYEYEQLFTKEEEKEEFPPESDLKEFKDELAPRDSPTRPTTIARIVQGYNDRGSNASVFSLVAYQQRLCAIKRTNGLTDHEDGGCTDANEDILFEMMTHAYLYEKIKMNENSAYQNIHIPEILFVQQAPDNKLKVDICMRRAEGLQLGELAEEDQVIALAHVLKALWHLQTDYDWMHRDLSSSNVFYDKKTRNVTLIDFGHSCVKMSGNVTSWQSDDDSFFNSDKDDDSYASNCGNRSLDACVLMTSLSWGKKDPSFWTCEANDMKKKMRELYEMQRTDDKKRTATLGEGIFTNTTVPDWYPGNGPKGDGKGGGELHHWIYEFVEFPMKEWYPENILKRLMLSIPKDEWSWLRRHWEGTFDTIIQDIPLQQLKTYCENHRIVIRANADLCPKKTCIESILQASNTD